MKRRKLTVDIVNELLIADEDWTQTADYSNDAEHLIYWKTVNEFEGYFDHHLLDQRYVQLNKRARRNIERFLKRQLSVQTAI
jgi:hypothetical protein